MKKPLLIFALLLMLITSASAQIGIGVGAGIAKYAIDTKESSDIGISLAISYNRFYLDFGGNFSSGEGEYLEFSSSETYPANKVNVVVFNAGYIIPVWKVFSLTPIIGVGLTSNIYQDPIGWDTYFTGNDKTHPNLGGILMTRISDNVNLKFGFGTFERFNVGILWGF